jgi:hypothetical protein
MAIKTLALTKLRTDGGTQLRVTIVHEHVSNLADAFRDDEKRKAIPPIEVVFDSVNYWVWDGNHRILAAQEAGQDAIRCNVEKGTQRDAILKAAGANQSHGMPRSHLDKRKAVGALLQDAEWAGRSDRWIAETCGVGHPLVAEVRKSTGTQLEEIPVEAREGKDGKRRHKPKRKPNIPQPTFIDEEPEADNQYADGGAEPVTSGPLAGLEPDPVGVSKPCELDRVRWAKERFVWLWDQYQSKFGDDAAWCYFSAAWEQFKETAGYE